MNVYEIVTEQIIKKITESGTIPWVKPWATRGGRMPTNAVSGKAYRGINPFLLSVAPYECSQWASFKQVQDLGGNVRKGEKASLVIFWKKLDPKVDASKQEGETSSAEMRSPFMLRYYNVFNLDQCDGVDRPELPPANLDINPIEAAAAILNGYQSAPSMEMGGGRAFYRPSADSITMPDLGRFVSPEAYYGTLFHEMTHSTGHSSRLHRFEGSAATAHFGDAEYSKEELVAEMGAAFLKREAGILTSDEFDQSAAYLQGWLKALKNDPKMLVNAAAQAQKAADHILGVKWGNE